MLPEAEMFVMAEQVLVEVLGRIREDDRDIVLPPTRGVVGAEQPATLWDLAQRHARDDAQVPALLGGAPSGPEDDRAGTGGRLGSDPRADLGRLAAAASAAAEGLTDGSAVPATPDGGVGAADLLVRLTLQRSFLAHYVAAYLGSTACPLPEELARPLWERTAPEAARWRDRGVFGDAQPLPDHVSWRDRFLLDAGHPPHPLGH